MVAINRIPGAGVIRDSRGRVHGRRRVEVEGGVGDLDLVGSCDYRGGVLVELIVPTARLEQRVRLEAEVGRRWNEIGMGCGGSGICGKRYRFAGQGEGRPMGRGEGEVGNHASRQQVSARLYSAYTSCVVGLTPISRLSDYQRGGTGCSNPRACPARTRMTMQQRRTKKCRKLPIQLTQLAVERKGRRRRAAGRLTSALQLSEGDGLLAARRTPKSERR
ncbi:hypothetical protein B0H11DRAFT_1909131 [Mycena galericulata]|nr:hypothetical protein B0H11DRAFT_1909131 [Mycena galericulata]